jgi:parallel beta-helix repeat protein
MTSSGNLNDAIDNITNAPNDGDGGTRAAFSSNIRSAIRLSQTLDVTSALTLNGRQRINTTTGGYTIGPPIGIDGSRMSGGDVIGIDIGAGADEASISGLALYGFTDNGGAAIQVGGGVTDVNISNNLIGLRENGRANRNENGIIVKDAASLTIDGNVIGRSRETGILVQPTQIDGTTDLTITNNMIGTNITRRNYRNKNAIILDGTGSNGGDSGTPGNDTFYISGTNIIQDNMIAYSRSGSGINVRGATDVDIIDNTITLNGIGISVGDNDALANDTYSSNVNVFGNEITRSSGNGIFVGDSSENVLIGSTNTGEGNRIGTNVRNRRGLGNRHNGVHINAAGPGVEISGNSIVGNGARRTSNGRSGIRLQEQLESVTISENNISSNREHGIQVDAAVAGTAVAADIQKNMLFRNYGSGIHLTNTTFALNIGSSTPSTANPTDVGNDFISNRRFGIDASSGDATIGGNKMLGNRRGGIDGTAAPVISAASLVSDDLTVDFGDAVNAPLANGEVHFYLGTGRSTRSQGLTYLGKTTTNGATVQFILTNLAAELRVRVGSSITMTYTPTGAGTSEFSRNVSVRRA